MNRNLVSCNIKRDVGTGTVNRNLDLRSLRALHHTHHGILRSLRAGNDTLTHLYDPVTLHEACLL